MFIDLRAQGTETVNGAIFSTNVLLVGAGTGLIDPFVRISTNNLQEQGYNTDATTDTNVPIWDNDNNNVILNNANVGDTNFVHSLRLSDLPIETIGGIGYYRFELDINEPNQLGDRNLSLDALQIWQASVGNLNTYDPGANPELGTGAFPAASGATLQYNLDAGGDNFIGLNGNLQSGSGNTVDMSVLIPISAFDTSKEFVYLYSAFGFTQSHTEPGVTYVGGGNDSGFEEWVRQIGQVIDGHKFHDLNVDGVWQTATEPALDGWTVYIDINNNNVLDLTEPFQITGPRDLNNDGDTLDVGEAAGAYQFFVTPGTYTIREQPTAQQIADGWIQTAPAPIGPDVPPSREFLVTLAEGQDAHNLNFGNFDTNPALNIVKNVSSVTGGTAGGAADSAGDVINYAITVQNTGNVTLTGLTVTDPFADAASWHRARGRRGW